MSECLLDDLVPQARFNKVTLESINFAGDDYKLRCDVSIFDVVRTEGDILTHFFSEDFRKYFTLITIIARDATALEMAEIIQGLEIEPYRASKLMRLMFLPLGGADPRNFLTIDNVPSQQAIDRLLQLFSDLSFESFDYHLHNFSTLPGREQTGINGFDDQGNIVYDLSVPFDKQPRFTNSTDVLDCKIFLIPHYSFESAMQDEGLTYSETLDRFSWGNTYSIDILVNERIVDSRVQDFRLVERVLEFYSPFYESFREKRIQDISNALGGIGNSSTNPYITNNTITPLMSTFGLKGRIDPRVITKNFFMVDVETILYRNSNRRFMYANHLKFGEDNLIDISPNLVNHMLIRKDRLDDKRNPVFIDKFQLKPVEGESILSYCFEDQEELDVGEYSYTLEMSIVDPLQSVVEGYVYDIRYNLLPKLEEAKEYINNTREYNHTRDFISNTGKLKMKSILDNTAQKDSQRSLAKLFRMLTGIEFSDLFGGMTKLSSIFNSNSPRRKVISLIKIANDILFETSKYFEIDTVYGNNSRVSPSSVIEFEHTFKETVDYGVKSRGLYDIVEARISGIDFVGSQFLERMKNEGTKFNPTGYEDFQNLGYLTPNRFNNLVLRDLTNIKDAFFSFFSTAVDGAEKPNILLDKALLDPENSNVSRSTLRKEHATFESFAATLGLSIESQTVRNRKKEKSSDQKSVLGVDYGRNSKSDKNSNFLDTGVKGGRNARSRSDRKSAILERRSKEEELISRFLNSPEGYDISRRRSIKQGDALDSRINRANVFQNLRTEEDLPVFLQDNGQSLILSDTFGIFGSLQRKVFLNNVYVVQYLKSIRDENGNLSLNWQTISDYDSVPDNVLCRLYKYRNDRIYVTDSYLVDREIMSKYFYLIK
tara:strand:+ start:1987 stop:4635 length:2649 start_codon:yes stop_codon:yes gene_type:complete